MYICVYINIANVTEISIKLLKFVPRKGIYVTQIEDAKVTLIEYLYFVIADKYRIHIRCLLFKKGR